MLVLTSRSLVTNDTKGSLGPVARLSFQQRRFSGLVARPACHGRLYNLLQHRPARTIACQGRHALHDRHGHGGECAGIRSGGQAFFPNVAFSPFLKRLACGFAYLFQSRSYPFRRFRSAGGCACHQASCRAARLCEPCSSNLQQGLRGLTCRRSLGNRLCRCFGARVAVTSDAFQKQRFLIAEGGIEAGRGDAHGGCQVVHARRFIPGFPKLVHRPVQHLFAIKGEGPPRSFLYRCLFGFHSNQYETT